MDVALLVRVSKDTQDYQRQVDDLTKVCELHGWNIVKIIVGKFSATKTRIKDRIDLPELVKLVRAKAIQKVLVTGLPRMGRNTREILEVYYFLKDFKVSVYIHQLKFDSGAENLLQQSMNDMFIGILSTIAQMETQTLSIRIKSGIDRARKQGKVIGRRKGSKEDFSEKIKTNPIYKKAATLLRQKNSIRNVAAITGLSKGTVEKIKKTLAF